MKPVLRIRNLGKKYQINNQQQNYLSLREEIKKKFRTQKSKKNFWALQDISFDVYEGECVGIIGKNGAGKSTLLKILSKITPPTKGYVRTRGRIASLLEVGTGFHPELTGRENIYLNGSILGLKRQEINHKFEQIVAFSGVEQFLYTPLKHYSSGMQLRLAFSVAAHLEPEILLIDEVLAVGDAEFQKKCLGKMEEVSKSGRTVIFVSHNMNTISQLCSSTILLNQGKILLQGNTSEVIRTYNQKLINKSYSWELSNQNSAFVVNPYFTPHKFSLVDTNLNPIKSYVSHKDAVQILVTGEIQKIDKSLNVGVAIYDENYTLIFMSCQTDSNPNSWITFNLGMNTFMIELPKHFFNEGTYFIELISNLHQKQWLLKFRQNIPLITMKVQGGFIESPHWHVARPGIISPVLKFMKLD